MNFNTVGTIRHGLRRGESGQAFTELTVSLIAILAAFVGFLVIAALSSDRIAVLIRARELADQKSSNGVSSQGGESIRYWDYGMDEIPFTTDDYAVPGSAGDGAFFKSQLVDNSRQVSLLNPPSSSALMSDFAYLQDNGIFVNAASLADGTIWTDRTFRNHNLTSLEPAINWLFHSDGSRVRDTVYMPAHKTLAEGDD